MINLSAQYLGMNLKHPIVASASPLSYKLDGIRQLEDAGASAVVLFSLFEEQLRMESYALDHFLNEGAESYPEALSYFPEREQYQVGPNEYMKLISQAKEVIDVPIIASLNGVSTGGWTEYARLMQEAGADAIELNLYYIPTDPDITGADLEQRYLETLQAVRQCVSIPVAVKLGPFFSSLPNMARRFSDAGANGLVLFNRFYQPDFDLTTLEVVPHLVLSNSNDLRLPLRWAAILYGRVPADIAVTSGVHTHEDVLKAVMAGASVTMMASGLLKNGLGRIHAILDDMTQWMEDYEYESVAQMKGSMSQQNVTDPAVFERANYVKTLQSYRPAATRQPGSLAF